jgi:FHS family L-fucose permease-like MFS transporter
MGFRAVKPRYVLATYLFGCFVFILAASQTAGNVSIAMICLVLCFESACFATIFALGLRGLGRHTKFGGALIVAAISGGAVFPPMTGAVATHLQKQKSTKPFHTAMLIPMGGFICAWIYPIYVNLFKRELMDGHRTTDVGIAPPLAEKEFSMVGSHVAKNDGHVTAV